MADMRRRDFIAAAGSTAVTWPLAVRAQQPPRTARIAVLTGSAENDPETKARLDAFRRGLEKLGWLQGRNVLVDVRHALVGVPSQAVARELIALKPDVIFANSTPMAAALQQETQVLPIVFVSVFDPIGSGFIRSLARPGGNLTGLQLYEDGVVGKWLAMLKELAPVVTCMALFANPKSMPYEYYLRLAEATARSLAIEIVPSEVESAADIEHSIESIARSGTGGLVLPPDTFNTNYRDLIIALAGRNRLPAIYSARAFVVAGGLVSYGTNRLGDFEKAAFYVDRILRGAKPADLPVEAPTQYETVINIKTAKALGLIVPDRLLATAHEVIE